MSKKAADQELLKRVRTRLRYFGLRIHRAGDGYNILDTRDTIEESGTLHELARKWHVPRVAPKTRAARATAAIKTAFEKYKAEKVRSGGLD